MRFHVKDSLRESSYVILPQSSQATYGSNINLGRELGESNVREIDDFECSSSTTSTLEPVLGDCPK